MKTEEAKEYAGDACASGLHLDVADITKHLPAWLKFESWRILYRDPLIDDPCVEITIRINDGALREEDKSFDAWIKAYWKWSGWFRVVLLYTAKSGNEISISYEVSKGVRSPSWVNSYVPD